MLCVSYTLLIELIVASALISQQIACLLPDRLAAAMRSQTWFPFLADVKQVLALKNCAD